MSLESKQQEMMARNAAPKKSHPKAGRRVRDLRGMLKRDDLTVQQRLQCIALLEKVEARMRAKRAARIANLPVAVAEPQVVVDPETVAACMAEMDRREAATNELQCSFRAQRRKWFDEHPAQAGEVLKAIGPAEFQRITAE